MNKNHSLNFIINSLQDSLNIFKSLGIDKYIRKFTISKFISLMIYAQITEVESIRAISLELNGNRNLQNAIHIESISYSQISRKLKELNPSTLEQMLSQTISEAHVYLKPNSIKSALGNLYLIDSSTISMSITQYTWAEFRKTKSGIKLHLRLKFCDDISLPDKAIITNARPADRKQMDNLVVSEEGAMNVFNRAYVDFKKFDEYCEERIQFVTRTKSNTIITLVQTYKTAENSIIISDEKVILGSALTQMSNPLRIIKTTDLNGKSLTILTNNFTKTAEEIADIYRLRWKIELFFKWMKQHLRVKTLYGKSANAVENQIFIALITYCLLIITKLREGYNGSLLTCLRIFKACIFNSYDEFLTELRKVPLKTSRGRQKNNSEQTFCAISNDFEKGETEQYNQFNEMTNL